jgi:uncharacterized RDD family membrane protein YckC
MFCPDCGWRNPDIASVCEMCKKPLPAQGGRKTVAPPPPVVGVRAISGTQVARLGDRMIAVVLDTVLVAAAFAVAGMWAAKRWGGVTEGGFSLTQKPALFAIGAALFFGFVYTFLLEGAFGATLGKAMTGVQVRMTHGGKCTMGASLVRNLLRIVDALAGYLVGFVIAIFSKQRQRLGDRVAGTVVVEHAPRAAVRALAVILWLAAVGGGAYGAWAIHSSAPAGTPGQGLTSSGFTLSNLEFLESDGGPVRKAGPYQPGDEVFLKYELTGFGTDTQNRADVAIVMVPLDPTGLPLDRPSNLLVREEARPSAPITGKFHFHLPSFVPPGTYKVVITVEDAVRKSSAEFSPTISVTARAIPPATKLEVRDFTFRSSEEGPPVKPPVFAAGGKVYYSFAIFGLGFRDDKASFRVGYRLVSPTGDVVIDRPDWQDLDDTFAYHPATFFLPLNAYVSLNADAPGGRYVQRHTVEDRITGARVEYESAFEIR